MNRIRDELRRAGARPQAGTLDSAHPDKSASPLERAIGREAVERYEEALKRLRPGDREAIIARVEMGYTADELVEVLGKPSVAAARKAVDRALVRLANEMRKLQP